MSRKWYGSLNNRIEENRMFTDEIKVGTGVTKYSWSDRDAYEVVEVEDQKHVAIREYSHKKAEGAEWCENKWDLISNPENPIINLVKRGNYWYSVVSLTPEEAKEILDGDDFQSKLWACHNNFDLEEVVAKGKVAKRYHKWNVSFGVANYYYDYEF